MKRFRFVFGILILGLLASILLFAVSSNTTNNSSNRGAESDEFEIIESSFEITGTTKVIYVSTASCASGTNTGELPDCSVGSDGPLKTINYAAQIATAGTTIMIRGGTYYPTSRIEFANSGNTSAGYITVTSYNGEDVIIDGSKISYYGWGGVLYIRGNSGTDRSKGYFKISGLKIVNSGWFGIAANYAHHTIIENNKTSDTASAGIYSTESNNITIIGNDVQMACTDGIYGNIVNGCSGSSDSQEMITLVSVDNFEVKNNEVHNGVGLHCGGEGIAVTGNSSYGTIHNNLVYDLPADFVYDGTDRGEVGIYVGAYEVGEYTHDIEIYNNIVSTPQGLAINAEQGGTTENIRIYNNIIYDVFWNGIEIGDCCGGNEGIKKNIYVFNNVVHHCGYGTDWGGGILMRATKYENIQIDNNIVSQNNTWQIRDKSGEALMRNNLIDGDNGGYSKGTNYIEGDPGFVDASVRNFRLTSNSIAINEGINVYNDLDFDDSTSILNFDYDDNSRSFGSVDIGPFEYVTGVTATPTTVIASTPTNSPTTTPTAKITSTPTPTTVTRTKNGVECGSVDTDNNGILDFRDFFAFAKIWKKTCNDQCYSNGCGGMDMNCDKTIDIIDFIGFAKRWQKASCKL